MVPIGVYPGARGHRGEVRGEVRGEEGEGGAQDGTYRSIPRGEGAQGPGHLAEVHSEVLQGGRGEVSVKRTTRNAET